MVCSRYQSVFHHVFSELFSFETVTDAMIDFGFVVAAFVPLVLYWM